MRVEEEFGPLSEEFPEPPPEYLKLPPEEIPSVEFAAPPEEYPEPPAEFPTRLEPPEGPAETGSDRAREQIILMILAALSLLAGSFFLSGGLH